MCPAKLGGLSLALSFPHIAVARDAVAVCYKLLDIIRNAAQASRVDIVDDAFAAPFSQPAKPIDRLLIHSRFP